MEIGDVRDNLEIYAPQRLGFNKVRQYVRGIQGFDMLRTKDRFFTDYPRGTWSRNALSGSRNRDISAKFQKYSTCGFVSCVSLLLIAKSRYSASAK